MIYILLAICFSVTVSVLFKLARRYSIDVFQAITWNYFTAILLTWLFLKPQFSQLDGAPVYLYSILGFLLPTLFVAVAASVRVTGIMRTDTAQRISLIVPIAAAYFYFNEQLSAVKIAGIAVGFIAVLLLLSKPGRQTPNRTGGSVWIYPLIVFLGFGLVDILFKQVALTKTISFGTSLFVVYVIAFALSIIGLLYLIISGKARFQFRYIVFGWILGIANFGNILFYVKAHQSFSKSPSIVFSAMNIGVITLGTLIGTIIFKEKTSWLNRIGIGLAIAAVIIITYSQLS
ncbi:DMT family transporter [Mucilaginibacter ginkgonis]|uniref:DMT family transporter n=1 Tax=Mucilaginibacter ginkgonis TaxID=2682091 RepID=A0A6I4HW95_9SPHI|nr:DMT family transporter [Mucilaginibacter ginkgonis]QQL51111.1 DMT family transporter [Mucilaginibacter ginkgonis]